MRTALNYWILTNLIEYLYGKTNYDTSYDCNTTRHPGYNGNIKFTCTEMNWISVEDRLPEDGEFVLCAYDDCIEYFHLISNEPNRVVDNGGSVKEGFGNYSKRVEHIEIPKGYCIRQLKTDYGRRWADEGVTHWMPLPEPPE